MQKMKQAVEICACGLKFRKTIRGAGAFHILMLYCNALLQAYLVTKCHTWPDTDFLIMGCM
jgi:hypothetical protein